MLSRLSVSNLAVVEKAEIEFDSGLNVITGETGAGKSVLLGALDLVLGGRSDASVVRDGAREAEVEAVFESRTRSGAQERKVIRRTITAEGRSRAWVDDESVSISELKEIGSGLVDVHGPTSNQKLVEESFQRETLGPVPVKYGTLWNRYSEIRSQIARLAGAEGVNTEDEVDMLRYQVGELDAAGLSEEDETIAERHAAAAHAEEIVENANAVTEGLGGDRGAADILISLQPKLNAMAKHFPGAQEWAKKTDELTLEIQELSRAIADSVSRLDSGEENLDELDARLTTVNKLRRKYRCDTIAALLELLETKRRRLDELEHREERLVALKAELAEAEKELRVEGVALTKKRKTVADRLARAVTKELKDLGFVQARFFVALEPIEPEAHGCDRVVFMFEPNPGESARPLAAIASMGEIARVMLALKVVLTSRQPRDESPLTLVFDEIDANIGGEVGKITGEKMRTVAGSHQVVAITHLPQSAVFGERHFVVSKSVVGGRTRTSVNVVEGRDRIREIARMLGGENLTSVVRKHAEELLEISR